MTTNKKLLELAAKAAGIENAEVQSWPGMDVRYGYDIAVFDDLSQSYWNPLEDDGDALRLATKLHFDIFVINDKLVKVKAPRISNMFSSTGGNDVNMLARYTIVRAAAEIGKIINYQSDSN